MITRHFVAQVLSVRGVKKQTWQYCDPSSHHHPRVGSRATHYCANVVAEHGSDPRTMESGPADPAMASAAPEEQFHLKVLQTNLEGPLKARLDERMQFMETWRGDEARTPPRTRVPVPYTHI